MNKFRLMIMTVLALVVTSLPALAQEPVTLRYYTAFSGASDEKEQALIAICEEQLGINVEYTTVVGDGVGPLMTELRALNTAGNMPDVFWMSSGFVGEFTIDGLLLNIQEYVDRDIMPVADEYFVGSFDTGRYAEADGDMFAFPNHFVETLLYYNIDAFDAAGLEYPTGEWTWDDFLTAAQTLTVDENSDGLTDQYGYYLFGRYAHIESWVYQNSGRFLNADKTEFAPNEQAVETLEFLASLISEHGVAPTPAEMQGVSNPFAQGIAAMWVDGSWAIDTLRATEDLNFGIAAIPRGPQWTEDTAFGWSDMTSISATTEHPEEAWALVNCLTGPNRTPDLVEDGKIPVYRAAAMSDEWLQADQLPSNKSFLLEWAENVGPTSFTPGWGEWRGYVSGSGLQGQLDEVFNGNVTLEQALTTVTDVANQVIARYYN